MALLTITDTDVSVDWNEQVESITGVALVAINAGEYVRFDPTTGKLDYGNATSAAEVGTGFVATKTVVAGAPLTAIKRGVVNVGNALSSLSAGASVFLSDTDGRLADAAGTVSTVIGKVITVFGNGATPDKLLSVEL